MQCRRLYKFPTNSAVLSVYEWGILTILNAAYVVLQGSKKSPRESRKSQVSIP